MAIRFTLVKCPECGADLPIEEEREQIFCSYCGSKVIVTNDNEYIYRHVDVAEVKQVETEKMIRLRELELEEKIENRNQRGRTIAYGIALFFVVISVICMTFNLEGDGISGFLGIEIGALIAIFTFTSGNRNEENRYKSKMARSGQIKLNYETASYEKKNYCVVQQAYLALGFRNVRVVNLKDLSVGLLIRAGTVENVTINGEDPEENAWYDLNSEIVILYHGFSDR